VIEGHVDLGDNWLQAVSFEFLLTEGPGEESSRVRVRLQLDQIGSGERGFSKEHEL
jgi:hypothetical protein